MRDYGELMLVELRKVIPEFLKRVDVAERGVAWAAYWRRDARARARSSPAKLVGDVVPEPRDEVTLIDHDPEGEIKIVAAVLYAAIGPPRRPAARPRARR